MAFKQNRLGLFEHVATLFALLRYRTFCEFVNTWLILYMPKKYWKKIIFHSLKHFDTQWKENFPLQEAQG